jgi:rhamnulokinase
MLGLPFHYRDSRCEVGVAAVHAEVPFEELYARNGLQFLTFNTLYQFAADPLLSLADTVLLVPDLITSWLTERCFTERTNASTTGLLDVRRQDWDRPLMARLGVADLFPELVDPGTTVGPVTSDIASLIGASLPVVTVGSHDTASAVVGVPMTDPATAAYISCGTWGLVGVELEAPVVTDEARAANFTNEGGVDGRTRFLTNVMGTWLLSETLRAWGESDLAGMLRAAAAYDEPVPVIDVQDERFLPPSSEASSMQERIATWCREHHAEPLDGRAAVVRCIVLSIAAAVATALERATSLSGRTIGVVHVVGGGAQNTLLCQAIADHSALPVLAGPVEATALGNVLVQARAAGVLGPGLADLRGLVARTHDLARYTPRCR